MEVYLNSTISKSKLLKLSLYSVFIVFVVLILKSYYYYQGIKVEVIEDAKREAHLLQDYMMSVRETYHKQFLQSGIELTDKTLGFLPAHATTLISDKFQKRNKYNFYIRNVTDKPRNPANAADEEELKAIDFFKNHKNNNLEYFKKYKEGNREIFQYAAPIYIEPYCLSCHGQKEHAMPTIRTRYDTAYDYKVGDVRGIVSIKIPASNINEKFYNYIKKEIVITILIFVLIGILISLIYKKVYTQIKDIETTAIDFASKDPLTKLYNRRFLQNYQSMHDSKMSKYSTYAVGFLDIDYFKKINDIYGHDAGDIVLCKFATLLKLLTRKEDIVCRYGGEEFLIIVYNISLDKAIEKFEKIRLKIEEEAIELESISVEITASIGLAFGRKKDKFKDIITQADKALYEAKAQGRNRLEVI